MGVFLLSCFYHLISDSANGDDFKILVIAESFAKATDMYVDGMGIGARIVAPDIVHKLLAGEDLAREGRHLE